MKKTELMTDQIASLASNNVDLQYSERFRPSLLLIKFENTTLKPAVNGQPSLPREGLVELTRSIVIHRHQL